MRNSSKDKSNFPIIEVFGSSFALLVVLFVIINVVAETNLKERLSKSLDNGTYKISWSNDSEGYIIIALEDSLVIAQNNTKIALQNICKPNSKFIDYFQKIYNTDKKQIIFAIVEGATSTMKAARNCMRQVFKNKAIAIGWMIANNELLKSVNIDDIPYYIKNH